MRQIQALRWVEKQSLWGPVLKRLQGYLDARQERKIAKHNYIAGTAWLAFERGEISREAFLRVMKDTKP